MERSMNAEIKDMLHNIAGNFVQLSEALEKQDREYSDRIAYLEYKSSKNADVLKQIAKTILNELE